VTGAFFERAERGWKADLHGVPRDGNGRPMLVPKDGIGGRRVPYTRASSLADHVSNHYGIHRWELRCLAVGLSQREDFCAMIASYPPMGVDEATDRITKSAIDEIVEKALDIGGRNTEANYGTAFHSFTSPGEHGRIPEYMVGDVLSYHELVARMRARPLGNEIFVANDEVMSAGTFDDLMWIPGYGFVITDKKTGKKSPVEWAVQLATYANAERCDPAEEAGHRWPILTTRAEYEDAGRPTLWHRELNLERAVIFWSPKQRSVSYPLELDIETGWTLAKMAAFVRDAEQMKLVSEISPDAQRRNIARAIEAAATELSFAQTYEAMTWIYDEYQSIWCPELTEVAEERKKELGI
jgi:hypothetical protein